jgi:hypothetical protein
MIVPFPYKAAPEHSNRPPRVKNRQGIGAGLASPPPPGLRPPAGVGPQAGEGQGEGISERAKG